MRRSKVVLELRSKTAEQTACPKAWNLIPICVGETKWATSKPHPSDSPQIPSAAVVFLSQGGSTARGELCMRLACTRLKSSKNKKKRSNKRSRITPLSAACVYFSTRLILWYLNLYVITAWREIRQSCPLKHASTEIQTNAMKRGMFFLESVL